MSKRHTLGVSKWLPSTEDKIAFKITLRPSTPNIDDDVFVYLCMCIRIRSVKNIHKMITYATTFFKPFFFEAALSVNLTTMLVMTTIFISKMEGLPPTSATKMIDYWLILCQLVPFAQVVLLTAIEYLREEELEKEESMCFLFKIAVKIKRSLQGSSVEKTHILSNFGAFF